MKAVVYQENGKIGMEERPVPKLQEESDALVKVTLTSICTSDLHIRNGAVPRAVPGTILGHEFIGIVEKCPCGTEGGCQCGDFLWRVFFL